MQETRQRILEILKVHGQATVSELSEALGLTAVTIRHHLEVLHGQGLIAPPHTRRRQGPGRPQHVYRLAEEAGRLFPKGYDRLVEAVLTELETRLAPEEMEDLVTGIAERMAAVAQLPVDGGLPTRLEATLEFLNSLGYLASAEKGEDGRYRLYVTNCPYEQVARRHPQPCRIDERMIARLLGVSLERLEWIAAGNDRCTYLLLADNSSS